MLRWQTVAVMAGSIAAGLIASAFIAPENIVRAVLVSPPGLVLIGRTAAVYAYISDLTGNSLLALTAGILFANTATVGTCLLSPLALHASYSLELKMRERRRWRLPLKTDWTVHQTIMLFIAFYLAAFTGLSVAVISMARSPAVFMLPELAYVAATSSTVYAASRTPYEGFVPAYKRMLLKAGPVIAALLLVSATVEAYELL